MKKLILVAAFFVCSLRPAAGSDDPALQQLLTSAEQRANLYYNQSTPLQLDVDFVVHLKVPIHGYLTLKWEAKDRWWRKMVVGDFQQIEVRNGDWHYTARNAEITPLVLLDLFRLVGFDIDSDDVTAKKERRRAENGVDMSCIQVERKDSTESSRNVCINAASGEILIDEWKEPSGEQHGEQFADYFDFQTHHYPRTLELSVNGSKVITANVSNLIPASFDESLLAPPPGAIARRECDDLKHAVLLRAPGLDFPAAARVQGGGKMMVLITVNSDGSAGNIKLASSSGIPLDDATKKALQSYKFKPAMCGTEPVVSDVTVEVNYMMSPPNFTQPN